MLIACLATIGSFAQSKDAQVQVSLTDFKGKVLPNEVVVFKSDKNNNEYQGETDADGKFALRLPAGAKYEVFVLGFKDSTSNTFLEIPALAPNTTYKDAFKMDLQFQPAKSFILEDLNFDSGKSTLQPGFETVLDELVAYLNRKETERIEIQGHTDNVGKPASNMVLSQDRANVVLQYLLSKGIAADRLVAKGYGSTQPIESNATEDGRASNRRTEIKILN